MVEHCIDSAMGTEWPPEERRDYTRNSRIEEEKISTMPILQNLNWRENREKTAASTKTGNSKSDQQRRQPTAQGETAISNREESDASKRHEKQQSAKEKDMQTTMQNQSAKAERDSECTCTHSNSVSCSEWYISRTLASIKCGRMALSWYGWNLNVIWMLSAIDMPCINLNWRVFLFGDLHQLHQIAELNTSPKIPEVW